MTDLLVALVLVILASVFVLFPLMMNRSTVSSDRRGVNVALFRERLEELNKQQQNGDIGSEELQRLTTELERRLLDDAEDADDGMTDSGKPPLSLTLLLVLVIPALAYTVYHHTGARADWQIAESLNQAQHQAAGEQVSANDVDSLLQKLNARLEQQPDNTRYLMLLGTTQMQQQNYPAASDAFQRLSRLLPEDPGALAQYAQALYLASGRRLTERVEQIAKRALALDPHQPTVLGMLGIANFEMSRFQQAIDYWQQLLPALGPASPMREIIQGGVDQAKALLAKQGVEVGPAAAESALPAASFQVQVSVADGVTVDPAASVFVFARAAFGPRMPLAVARFKASALPNSVTLDDSMAMAPGFSLSSFEQVEVIARISKSGIANPAAGDIEGKLGPVTVAEVSSPLSVIINQVLR